MRKQLLQDKPFGIHIQVGSGLIKYEDFGSADECTGYGDTLALAGG
ncbi:MAG TPA: hypothetical protein PK127_03790 [Clostridiales bacterium]|nr:hypothetical protein [Clostridiales bacterium]